jgi:hypothetical protein
MVYIDTGCVYCGTLTAYEVNTGEIITVGTEREAVLVDVKAVYEKDPKVLMEMVWADIDRYIKDTNQLRKEVVYAKYR